MSTAIEKYVNTQREAIAARDKALKNQQWAGKLTNQEKIIVHSMTTAYGLDPALQEIVVLGGRGYVTVAGLDRIANNTGQYSGCRYNTVPNDDGSVTCTCTVSKIISVDPLIQGEFQGSAEAGGPGEKNPVGRQFPRRMAETRARGRALRTAFSVSLVCAEELPDFDANKHTITAEMVGEPDTVDAETGEVKQ